MQYQYRIVAIESGAVLVQSLDDVEVTRLRIRTPKKYVENEIIRVETVLEDSQVGWSRPTVVASQVDPTLIGETVPQLVDWGEGDSAFEEYGDPEAFDAAVECLQRGDHQEAGRRMRECLREFPLHIDSYHHLGIIESKRRRLSRALKYHETGYRIGLLSIPAGFDGRLPWGILSNRPFLRAAHGFALALQEKRRVLEACEIYERLLALNPNDNQGVRYLLPEAYLAARAPAKAKEALEQLDLDGMNFYSLCLLEIVGGRFPDAVRSLCRGLSHNVHLPRLVLGHLPRTDGAQSGYVTMGGESEALDYLDRWARHWRRAAPRKFLTRALAVPALKDRVERAYALHRRLEGLPVGEDRSRVVGDLYSLFNGEAIGEIVAACRERL